MEENIVANEGTSVVNVSEGNEVANQTESPGNIVSEIAPTTGKTEVAELKSNAGRRRILEGRVVSNKPDKTIIVLVERYVQHPLYKKYYKRSKKFMAHDEKNECQVGDLVRIIEWRPLSRRKRWMLKEIVERAK